MTSRRYAPLIACAAAVAVTVACALVCPLRASCAETEVIRGTVDKLGPGSLSLIDVTLPGGEDAGRPIMVILTEDTEFFDGPSKTNKHSITGGLKVLVKSVPGRTGRVAVIVRIIGGKIPAP